MINVPLSTLSGKRRVYLFYHARGGITGDIGAHSAERPKWALFPATTAQDIHHGVVAFMAGVLIDRSRYGVKASSKDHGLAHVEASSNRRRERLSPHVSRVRKEIVNHLKAEP
jgi:hypothetical protein